MICIIAHAIWLGYTQVRGDKMWTVLFLCMNRCLDKAAIAEADPATAVTVTEVEEVKMVARPCSLRPWWRSPALGRRPFLARRRRLSAGVVRGVLWPAASTAQVVRRRWVAAVARKSSPPRQI